MICYSNAPLVGGNTSRARFTFHKMIMPGIINTSDILFLNPIRRTYKHPSIIGVIVPYYSSKKMGILNEHFPACIADFIGLPQFSRFPWGLKSHVLISHDYLSQSKFVPLPRDQAAMCSRPASKKQKKFCFVSKQDCIYCIRSEG